MTSILVRYTTRADKASENEELIHAVFDELRETAPAGFRYSSFKLGDGSTFVHLAQIDTADGTNPLLALESFRRFQAGLPERCLEAPVSTELVPVDAYGARESDLG